MTIYYDALLAALRDEPHGNRTAEQNKKMVVASLKEIVKAVDSRHKPKSSRKRVLEKFFTEKLLLAALLKEGVGSFSAPENHTMMVSYVEEKIRQIKESKRINSRFQTLQDFNYSYRPSLGIEPGVL